MEGRSSSSGVVVVGGERTNVEVYLIIIYRSPQRSHPLPARPFYVTIVTSRSPDSEPNRGTVFGHPTTRSRVIQEG
jgi:hypothetical protein